MASTALNCVFGFGIGYGFAVSKAKEDEVKHGNNYLVAAVPLSNQVALVISIASLYLDMIGSVFIRIPAKIAINAGILVVTPPIFLAAAIRDGYYPKIKEFLSYLEGLSFGLEIPKLKIKRSWTPTFLQKIPACLSEKAIKTVNFITDNTGETARVAMIVGSLGLIAIGQQMYGSMVLVAIAYEVLDNRLGVVPRRISLFMETYMPMISGGAYLFSGTWVLQAYGALQLALYFADFNSCVQGRVDDFIRKKMGFEKSSSIADIDAPLRQQKALDYNEIMSILNNSPDLEINYVYFSKSAEGRINLPKDNQFDDFQKLFDKVDWGQKYKLVLAKCKDDDQFFEFLVSSIGGAMTKDLVKADINAALKQAEAKAKKPEKEFVLDWYRGQMKALINILSGRVSPKGTRANLDDGISNCAQVLAHLKTLSSESVEMEDTLLALTVEGGDYCARGIKNVSHNVLKRILSNLKPGAVQDPAREFETKVYQTLEDTRGRIIEHYYQQIINQPIVPDSVQSDVHALDIYRTYLSIGFFPLTPNERFNVRFSQLFTYWIYQYKGITSKLYNDYREGYDAAVKEEIGDLAVVNYIRGEINNNPSLNENQKEKIIEILSDASKTNDVKVVNQKFRNLMYVMLGILKG